MQAGTLATSDVRSLTSRVLVNGIQREHSLWSIRRELSGDLPEQVVSGSGVTQATGTIAWATGPDVAERSANPWNTSTGWLPKSGDRVQIYAGDTVTEWIQFTGRIDTTSGDIGESAQSTIIDDWDDTTVEVSHLPLLRIMPPDVNNGPYRGIGLNASYFANLAMRASGFYSTPRRELYTALSVPAQGSMWPETGTMVTGGSYTGVGSHNSLNAAPWGWAVGNFNYTYTPDLARPASDPVQLSFMVAPGNAGLSYLRATYGSSLVQLSVNGSGVVAARVNDAAVASFTLAGGGIVQMLVKNNVVTLKSSNGQSATASVSFSRAAVMDKVLLSGMDGARIAGVQISHPDVSSQEFAALSHQGTARLDFSDVTLSGIMDASRAIENVVAGELLKDVSSGTLTGMWIDELGVLQWVSSSGLRSRAPARTVTTLNDILALSWEDSLLGSRSKVTVNGYQPLISVGRNPSRLVWQGRGEEMSSEEVTDEFAGPDDDTEWVQPDGSLTLVSDANWSDYNLRQGSYAGVFYTSSGEPISSAGLSTAISMGRLGMRQFRIRHTAGTFPSGVTAVQGTSPTAASLWPRNRDVDLPVIRTFAKSQWPKIRVSPVSAGGVGPELVHEAGPWTNETDSTERLERIATFIAGQTAVPKPVITGLKITYDPRLQLGDVITVTSENLMGVELRCLVVGMDNGAADSFTQSLSVRIISAKSLFTTYAEFNAAGGNLTYQQWSMIEPLTQSYAQFNDAA